MFKNTHTHKIRRPVKECTLYTVVLGRNFKWFQWTGINPNDYFSLVNFSSIPYKNDKRLHIPNKTIVFFLREINTINIHKSEIRKTNDCARYVLLKASDNVFVVAKFIGLLSLIFLDLPCISDPAYWPCVSFCIFTGHFLKLSSSLASDTCMVLNCFQGLWILPH